MDINEVVELKKDRNFYVLSALGLLFVHWVHQALMLSGQDVFPADIVRFLMGFNTFLFIVLTVWFGNRAGLKPGRIAAMAVLSALPFIGVASLAWMAWDTRRVEHLVNS